MSTALQIVFGLFVGGLASGLHRMWLRRAVRAVVQDRSGAHALAAAPLRVLAVAGLLFLAARLGTAALLAALASFTVTQFLGTRREARP